ACGYRWRRPRSFDRLPATCHRTPWRNQRACASCSRSREHIPEDGLVTERATHSPVDLIVLVPFPGHEHDIFRRTALHGGADRNRPVVLHQRYVRADKSGKNVRDDLRRLLGARIVVRDNRLVGQLARDSSHHGTLTRITVPATSEDNTQSSATMGARGGERLDQSIGRVRIIDNGERYSVGAA